LRRIGTEKGGAGHPVHANEPVGEYCQEIVGGWGKLLSLGCLGREGNSSGTLSSCGRQRETGKGVTGPAWLWIFPSTLEQSDGWLGDRSVRRRRARQGGGGRRGRKTNGRQAGLSRKLSETQLLAGMGDQLSRYPSRFCRSLRYRLGSRSTKLIAIPASRALP